MEKPHMEKTQIAKPTPINLTSEDVIEKLPDWKDDIEFPELPQRHCITSFKRGHHLVLFENAVFCKHVKFFLTITSDHRTEPEEFQSDWARMSHEKVIESVKELNETFIKFSADSSVFITPTAAQSPPPKLETTDTLISERVRSFGIVRMFSRLYTDSILIIATISEKANFQENLVFSSARLMRDDFYLLETIHGVMVKMFFANIDPVKTREAVSKINSTTAGLDKPR